MTKRFSMNGSVRICVLAAAAWLTAAAAQSWATGFAAADGSVQPGGFGALTDYLWIVVPAVITLMAVTGIVVRINSTLRSSIREAELAREALQKNEQKFREILMDLPSAITVTNEETGALLFLNRAGLEITGTDQQTAVGKNAGSFWEYPEQRQSFVDRVKSKGSVTSFLTRMLRRDGTPFWVSISSRRTIFEGQPALFSIFMDVDERKRLDEELLASERRFRELLAIVPAAVAVISRADGCFRFLNREAKAILEIQDEDMNLPSSAFLRQPEILDLLDDRLEADKIVSGIQLEVLTTAHEPVWVMISATLAVFEGEPAVIVAFTNISASKRTEQELLLSRRSLAETNERLQHVNGELERMAAIDQLTQVWNRREFERHARIEMSRAQRYRQPLSMLLFDIDHFKLVNDRYGHLAGDTVLRELCDLVRTRIRPSDILARWGGEEFVILIPAADAEQGAEAAGKLLKTVSEHLFPEVGPVTVSIGVAQYIQGQTLDDWLIRADQAMYRAKAEGRNRVCR